jgi:long-chain-alcohol oxidase
MQAVYSDEHADLRDGYGLKYETTAIHPGLPAAFLPWRSAAGHAELMRQLPHMVGVGVLLRDRGEGVVRIHRRGAVSVRYRLSDFDRPHVRTGISGAATVLQAAGARRIVTSHPRLVEWRRGGGDLRALVAAADAAGYDTGRCLYYSFHQMGSARMGDSPRNAACNPDGETWEARNVVVCDASTFPSASGVNPMITIAATAYMTAFALAARLSC